MSPWGKRIDKIRKLNLISRKDPNRPKKPLSSFRIYVSKERKENELKTAGETWNSNPVLRKQYRSIAAEMKAQYRLEMKSYMDRLGNAYDEGEFSDDDLDTVPTKSDNRGGFDNKVKSSFTENASVTAYYPKPLPAPSLPSVFPVFSERQFPPSSCQGYKKIGIQHGLFYYNPPRSGNCFLHPRGLRVAEKLLSFLTSEYHKRGYIEVTSPSKLWEKSGNAVIDYESIFLFDGNDKDPALVNMLSMFGHILKYGSQVGSSRDLPLRIADVGVLRCTDEHTHVQRFHHGESRVFCTEAQLVNEVMNVLDLVSDVSRTLGLLFSVNLCLSRRSGYGGCGAYNTELELVRVWKSHGTSWKLEGGSSSGQD